MFRTAKIAKNHGRIVKSRGVNFGPGIFAGFDNCSHAIIPITKNPEYPPPAPPPPRPPVPPSNHGFSGRGSEFRCETSREG